MLFNSEQSFCACSDLSCSYCYKWLCNQTDSSIFPDLYGWTPYYAQELLEKRKEQVNYNKEYARHCFHSPHLVTTKNCYVEIVADKYLKFDDLEAIYMGVMDSYRRLESRKIYYVTDILDINKYNKHNWDDLDDLLFVMCNKEMIPLCRVEEEFSRMYSYVLR